MNELNRVSGMSPRDFEGCASLAEKPVRGEGTTQLDEDEWAFTEIPGDVRHDLVAVLQAGTLACQALEAAESRVKAAWTRRGRRLAEQALAEARAAVEESNKQMADMSKRLMPAQSDPLEA